MNIRPATARDLNSILEIYNDAVLNTTATYDYTPRSYHDGAAWFEEHQKISYPVYVAENEVGEILGWSSLSRFHSRPGFKFTAENSVYVGAVHRGKGVGKALMTPLLADARLLKLRAIIAAIDAENPASVRLHASFGFRQVGRLEQVGFKFGRWLDVIYMELLL